MPEEAYRDNKAEGGRQDLKFERLNQVLVGEPSQEKVTPEQEVRGELHKDEVNPPKEGGPSSGSGQREPADKEDQLEVNHNAPDQLEAAIGSHSIETATETDVEDIKSDNPLSKMRNSIGFKFKLNIN